MSRKIDENELLRAEKLFAKLQAWPAETVPREYLHRVSGLMIRSVRALARERLERSMQDGYADALDQAEATIASLRSEVRSAHHAMALASMSLHAADTGDAYAILVQHQCGLAPSADQVPPWPVCKCPTCQGGRR